jgi:hypothetical protein
MNMIEWYHDGETKETGLSDPSVFCSGLYLEREEGCCRIKQYLDMDASVRRCAKRARGPRSQVWNDSHDVGFFVLSPRTGVMKLFLHHHNEWGPDGSEIVVEVYSTPDGEFSIKLFNDLKTT